MKKVLLFLMLFSLLSLTSCKKGDSKIGKYDRELTIFNVEDYISQGQDGYVDVISDFEKYYYELTGKTVKVNYYTYDTNETMYNQFKLQPAGTYDLVCTSDYMIQKMIKENLVDPIDKTKIQNYEQFGAKVLREKLRDMEVLCDGKTVSLDEYAVGYMWGTLGIVYDPSCSDSICDDVASWDVFWDSKYEHLISIKNSIRDAFVTGLMHSYSKSEEFKALMEEYIDYPMLDEEDKNKSQILTDYNRMIQEIFDFKLDGSSESDLENLNKIARVKEELILMKQNIFGLEVDSGKNDIITGKIKMNLAYSGDAVYSIDTALEELDKTLEYAVPLDGSNIWYDAWTMPKGAKNSDIAYMFLDYLSDPKHAADNMDYIGYTPYIVGDDIFTLAGAWHGACDYDVNSYYSGEDGVLVIYEDELFEVIQTKEAEDLIYPTDEAYFSSCEYDSESEYVEEDMVSYNGKIYVCLESTSSSPEESESWEEVEPYDLTFLFGGSFEDENRRPLIYPYPSCVNRLEAQYPNEYIIARCAIMNDFGSYNENVVIMWGQVKAYTNMVPVYIFLGVFCSLVIGGVVYLFIRRYKAKQFKNSR